jgi:nanoRNase/pAp phosphatase (c-di-AMP/oligoRNAs hydrolase)
MSKAAIKTIAEKNRVIENIIEAMMTRDRFLLVGHRNPDDDCLASMVAFSILLSKFSKKVYMLLPGKMHEHFAYLLNICKHNMIEFVDNQKALPEGISTVAFFDTPKPEMMEELPLGPDLLHSERVIKLEFDHHLYSDSDYIGDDGYRLVDDATSSSELVGILGLKLNHHKELLRPYQIDELLSRNFILAVLTGIIGDSKMGKYLKTEREKWYYTIFTRMFNDLLVKKTYKDSRNFSTMEDIQKELESISVSEAGCGEYMMKKKVMLSPVVGAVILTGDDMSHLMEKYTKETIINAARGVADLLAEETGRISIVAYCDDPVESSLIQFRMRRSQNYHDLDLRTMLEYFGIDNGGGHPGAIGFRMEKEHIPDFNAYVSELVAGAEKLMGFKPLD